jgi:hypothetical protein
MKTTLKLSALAAAMMLSFAAQAQIAQDGCANQSSTTCSSSNQQVGNVSPTATADNSTSISTQAGNSANANGASVGGTFNNNPQQEQSIGNASQNIGPNNQNTNSNAQGGAATGNLSNNDNKSSASNGSNSNGSNSNGANTNGANTNGANLGSNTNSQSATGGAGGQGGQGGAGGSAGAAAGVVGSGNSANQNSATGGAGGKSASNSSSNGTNAQGQGQGQQQANNGTNAQGQSSNNSNKGGNTSSANRNTSANSNSTGASTSAGGKSASNSQGGRSSSSNGATGSGNSTTLQGDTTNVDARTLVIPAMVPATPPSSVGIGQVVVTTTACGPRRGIRSTTIVGTYFGFFSNERIEQGVTDTLIDPVDENGNRLPRFAKEVDPDGTEHVYGMQFVLSSTVVAISGARNFAIGGGAGLGPNGQAGGGSSAAMSQLVTTIQSLECEVPRMPRPVQYQEFAPISPVKAIRE